MNASEDQAELIGTLKGLVDRLCSPDLTLAESSLIYDRLMELLERIGGLEPKARTPRPMEPAGPLPEAPSR
jgi:hypothetical protein